MNLAFNNDEINFFINASGVDFFLGANQSGKTHILTLIAEGFNGKNKKLLVNGRGVISGDYNVVFLGDSASFETEFKFSKSNIFKELIYDDILNNINSAKLLNEVNKIFDKIDIKVNKFLEYNVNRKQNEKIHMDIEIDNINTIIEKFTNIYIDNYLLKEDKIPISIRRKLIYNLLLFQLNKSKSNTNIVCIDNFDLYLDRKQIKEIIYRLEEYHQRFPNTYFFLTTSNNIYDLIKNKNSIFHIQNNKISYIKSLEEIFAKAYLEEIWSKNKNKNNKELLDNFIDENRNLIVDTDLKKIEKKFLDDFQNNVGNIFVSDAIELKNEYNYKNSGNYIVYKSMLEKYIYKFIISELYGIDRDN